MGTPLNSPMSQRRSAGCLCPEGAGLTLAAAVAAEGEFSGAPCGRGLAGSGGCHSCGPRRAAGWLRQEAERQRSPFPDTAAGAQPSGRLAAAWGGGAEAGPGRRGGAGAGRGLGEPGPGRRSDWAGRSGCAGSRRPRGSSSILLLLLLASFSFLPLLSLLLLLLLPLPRLPFFSGGHSPQVRERRQRPPWVHPVQVREQSAPLVLYRTPFLSCLALCLEGASARKGVGVGRGLSRPHCLGSRHRLAGYPSPTWRPLQAQPLQVSPQSRGMGAAATWLYVCGRVCDLVRYHFETPGT